MALLHGLTVVLAVCAYATSQEYTNGECYIDSVPARCEPVRMSFSLGQIANSSSTCGEYPSPYCERSISLARVVSDCSQGEFCDASDLTNAHSVAYLTDFPLNNLWWQSENSLNADNRVVIDIPLLTLAEITLISLDFHSIKPAAFHIEKSVDYGATYEPYHYFAISCEDEFPTVEMTISSDTSVLCQTILEPPSPGSISFFPVIDRPSANDSTPGYSESLYEFTTATNIRVILDQHYTLELTDDDPGYYYAIDDINVIGSCQCFGHASQCIMDGHGVYECACTHNTFGKYCEQCQEFYNDIPWQRADGREPFECKICNCNNHSTECVFDEDVYQQTGGISGGVCINCSDNTDGRQCEKCAPFYYPRPDRYQTDPDICEACQCSLPGVVDNGDCVKESDGLNEPGDCYCKANVMGGKCDMCIPGYYNLTADNPDGCQVCRCSSNGSSNQTCNHVTGECECKPNIIGPQCDTCRENHYQPDPNEGCLPCDCNLGGSISAQCHMTTGDCDCLEGVTGTKCSETISGKFFPTIDYLRLEGEFANSVPPSLNILATGEGEQFTGTGYYRVVEEGISNFGTLLFPVSGMYEVIFRYNLVGALSWNNVILTIRAGSEHGNGPAVCSEGTELSVGDTSIEYTYWNMGTAFAISQNLCFRSGRSYTFILNELISGQASSPILDIDSLVAILIDAPSLLVFGDSQLIADYLDCVHFWRRVPTITFAEPICEQISFTFSTAIYNGTRDCDCDPIGSMSGSVCEAFGGQCVCLPGVRGRRCDECRPGTYDLAPTGCTSCTCDPVGSTSDFCELINGTCECLPNVAGSNCSTCEPNYWGLSDGVGCISCLCNEIGSISMQCDDVSGECSCKPGVVGAQCDSCEEAYFGFSSNGCSSCSCDQGGSSEQGCDVDIGQCICKENTQTRDCSECVAGTFNLQENNPSGCQPCFCSGLNVTCSNAPSYVSHNISTDFSTGIQGWNVLTTDYTLHPDPDVVLATIPFSNGVTILPNSTAFLQAPQEFLGNKLSSYLQFITIKLETLSLSEGVETTTSFDVVITGNHLQLGAHFSDSVISGAETLQIQLHESFGWYHTSTYQAASADDMQTVLSLLDELFITASFNSSVIIESINLDTVQLLIDVDDTATVSWVEQCDCPINYSGLSCEECSMGYTRSISNTCEPCQCNGFSNTCDPKTGSCINCTGSTTGASCEQCLPGTYGDPVMGIPCFPCPCPLTIFPGQFSQDCIMQSPDTIICLNCPVGHTGNHCESCNPGYFGDPTGDNGTPTGCSDCLCNGNIDSSIPNSCDTTTGICLKCVNNTAGSTCEQCANGYFGDAIFSKNCTACNCDPTGSMEEGCDHLSGECFCLPNIEGAHCEQCSPGYFGFNSGTGCTLCNCNVEGSVGTFCDSETGQCSCKPGVTGLLCDQCDTGFFGLTLNGCQACNCSATNSMGTCDSSGMCQCQPGSTGNNCEACVDNYFQDTYGCNECPQCYQELSAIAQGINAIVDRTNSSLLNLRVENSPYDPRLNEKQDEVNNIADLGQIYIRQHDQLQMQVEGLRTAINQTLQYNVLQLDISLQLLKTTSTPVFIQALAAEELMNRTIVEFVLAQEEIYLLAEFYIPNITRSLETINISHSLTFEALQSATLQIQLLKNRFDQISDLVSELNSLINSSLITVYEIDTLNEHILNASSTIQENLFHIHQTVYSLMQRSTHIVVSIMQVTARVLELESAVPMILSSDVVNIVQANISYVQYTLKNLSNQVSQKLYEISFLQGTIAENKSKVNVLSQTFFDLSNQTVALGVLAQSAITTTMTALDNVDQKVYQTEEVLENLQNYSGDTFDVGERANEALTSLEDLTDSANNVIETIAEVQQNVSAINNVVEDALYNTFEAINITKTAEMSFFGVNTTMGIALSVDSTNRSLAEAMELKADTTTYSNTLEALGHDINSLKDLVQNGSLLVSESDQLITEANRSINTLVETLSSLNSLGSSQLQRVLNDIQSQLSLIDESSTDVEMLYLLLNQTLLEQREKRLDLESYIVSMKEDMQYLQYLQSMLPSSCDSNL